MEVSAYAIISAVSGAVALFSKADGHRFAQVESSPEVLNRVRPKAEKNQVWTYLDLAETPLERSVSGSRMRFVKWATYIIDYLYLFTLMYVLNTVFMDSFTPVGCALSLMVVAPTLVLLDYVKGPLIAPDIISPIKRKAMMGLVKEAVSFANPRNWGKILRFLGKLASGEGIVRDWSDPNEASSGLLYHIFYLTKTVSFVMFAGYAFVHIGMFYWEPFGQVKASVNVGNGYGKVVMNQWSAVYLEYLIMSFIKDASSMNVLHKLMHEKWYWIHKTHHMPKRELHCFQTFYFSYLDVIIENTIAPLLVCSMKALWGVRPALHFASFLLLVITDVNVHSCSPFSIGFFNPILDGMMKCALSHSLHHALNKEHYTVWPWHQLSKYGQDQDVAEYNAVMQTKIFFHGDKPPMLINDKGTPLARLSSKQA